MYLKLGKEDMDVLTMLAKGTENTAFLNAFIKRILDLSKYRNGVSRNLVWGRVWAKVGKEWGDQRLKGKVDNFALLRTALSELTNMKLEIPFDYELMIRNIGAMKELLDRQGMKLEDLFESRVTLDKQQK